MRRVLFFLLAPFVVLIAEETIAQRTQKPPLHGQEWMAITGKPLAATAGAMVFLKGGNAVDSACAMIAATSTMWDTLAWGGETQALIWNPHTCWGIWTSRVQPLDCALGVGAEAKEAKV